MTFGRYVGTCRTMLRMRVERRVLGDVLTATLAVPLLTLTTKSMMI